VKRAGLLDFRKLDCETVGQFADSLREHQLAQGTTSQVEVCGPEFPLKAGSSMIASENICEKGRRRLQSRRLAKSTQSWKRSKKCLTGETGGKLRLEG
jgi:hypothetical protein